MTAFDSADAPVDQVKVMTLAVGEMVRAARVAAGYSQTRLANEMRDLGHPWMQQTVVGVEQGVRNLRWVEGLHLGSLIGFQQEPVEPQIMRDAMAYRRILQCIAENESAAAS